LHREGGVWSVDELGQGTWSSIAVDSHGSPRIAFYDPVALDLVMATRSNNTWTMTPIDQAHDVGLHPSQVIYNDVSYISYYEHTHGALMYGAFTSPNSFSRSLVDYSADVGAWSSMAFDANGRPHIAYQDVTNGALKYAVGNTALPVRKATLGQVKALYRK
jgi:hypothetical protein